MTFVRSLNSLRNVRCYRWQGCFLLFGRLALLYLVWELGVCLYSSLLYLACGLGQFEGMVFEEENRFYLKLK